VPADGIALYVDLPRSPAMLEIDVVGRLRPSARAFYEGLAWVA
jgi:hypothetical protein